MRVLKTSQSNVENFVLRGYSSNGTYDYVLTNENNGSETTDSTTQSNSTIIANMNQLQITIPSGYNEGDVFAFKVIDNGNSEILYRTKFFFTDQVPQNYSIND